MVAALVAWLALLGLAVWGWVDQSEWAWQGNPDLGVAAPLAVISALIWWCVLLWAIHHLTFQLGSLMLNSPPKASPDPTGPPIAILYTTCDDFNTRSCKSCVQQDYQNFRVLILDDSSIQDYKNMVDAFCAEWQPPKCELVRRDGRDGFKAGNLNHGLAHVVNEEWVLLVDADQVLPTSYLSTLASRIPVADISVAFIQTSNDVEVEDARTSRFQRALALTIPLYFFRDLSLRQRFGFVPLLGHGALVRRGALKETNEFPEEFPEGCPEGFPEAVSEDYAFAMQTARKGQTGLFAETPAGTESLPHDFGGFMLRLRKYAGGTAELFRMKLIPFLRSHHVQVVEKWDGLMQLGWYPLMPLVTLNGFLSAFVVHRLWEAKLPYLSPVLPFLYAWMLLALLCLYLSVTHRRVRSALRSVATVYFWSTALHAAAMPIASISFLRHLLLPQPSFPRTPKNGEAQDLKGTSIVFMIALGLLAIAAAVYWNSPFSPVLVGQGVAYGSYPLYGKLCAESLPGEFSRIAIFAPGALMLFGLFTMWQGLGFTLPLP
jgi:cellulose synthase/poly-beta-1,6-N-acetylglucosamine synthase-like glycosyltransferase